jgi:hypothetical protein
LTHDRSEPEEYVAQRVREALAEDPRVGELYVRISLAGDRIFITGMVPTEDRRRAITEVVAELCPGYEIANQTTVNPISEPPPAERIE